MFELTHDDLISPEGIFQETELRKVIPVSGGCIHQSWCIELLSGEKFFAKTTSKENFLMLKFEANCLKTLKEFINEEYLIIPEPITIKSIKNHSILLLPWLKLNTGDEICLGKGLALMHQASTTKNIKSFGWEMDGFIGTSSQKGGWHQNWGFYFVNYRLKPQLDLASKKGIINFDYTKSLTSLINFLNQHNPEPSLVHGDLWSGNKSISNNGRGIIFDPASYWADREVDIAMSRLFGGFSEKFYSGYNSIWKLSNSSAKRINIYNLYHILNHANIFGGNYIQQSISLLNKIIFEVNN